MKHHPKKNSPQNTNRKPQLSPQKNFPALNVQAPSTLTPAKGAETLSFVNLIRVDIAQT
jgi:hypothetical protein